MHQLVTCHHPDITPLGILINNYSYGKSEVRITRDFLFVDLRKKMSSFNSRFRRVKLSICITILDETKLRIICLTKPEDFPQIISFLCIGHNKRLRGQTIDKNATIPNLCISIDHRDMDGHFQQNTKETS